MPDIFISYSRKDASEADALAKRLRASGASVWMDTAALAAAETWSAEIVGAIRDCKVFVVLLSNHSVDSINVTKELALASGKNKSIVAIELDSCKLNDAMEYALAGLHRISYDDEISLVRTFEKLGIAIADRTPNSEPARTDPSSSENRRLAVMPFEDHSPSNDHEWFSDGLTFELIDALGKLSKISVIDRHTSREYKKTLLKSSDLARELNVRYLVFGTVLKAGDRLRIQAELLDSQTHETLWTFKHTGVMDDIFEIQERVAKEIAEGLQLKLTPQEAKKLEERPTSSAEAYELYLRGMAQFLLQSHDGFRSSVELYEQCVGLDPKFALAYVGLANSLLGIYRSYDRDPALLDRAQTALDEALVLNPHLSNALSILAILNLHRGEKEQAVGLAQKAVSLAPDDYHAHFHLGFIYMSTGQHLPAAREFEEVIRFDAENLGAHLNLAIEYFDAGDEVGARRASERALPVIDAFILRHPDELNKRMSRALFLEFCKRPERFSEMEAVLSHPTIDPLILYNFAWIYTRNAMYDRAFELLERAIAGGFVIEQGFSDDPVWGRLRDREGWARLLALLEGSRPGGSSLAHSDRERLKVQPLGGSESSERKPPQRKPATSRLKPDDSREQRTELKVDRQKRRAPMLIAGAVLLIAICLGGYFLFFGKKVDSRALAGPRRIAVLPFENVSFGKEDEYFADGLTAELINMLAPIDGMQVTDRISSMGYKGVKRDTKSIARELGVRYIVGGTVNKQGNAVRISVQLTDADSGSIILSKEFEGKTADLLSLQEQVARGIVYELQLSLDNDAAGVWHEQSSPNAEAYRLSILGGGYTQTSGAATKEDIERGIDYFEQAVALDPTFAYAYQALANQYLVLYLNYGRLERDLFRADSFIALSKNANPSSVRYLETATRIAVAHNDIATAMSDAKLLIEQRPKQWQGYEALASLYYGRGNYEQAAANFEESIKRNALRLSPMFYLIDCLNALGDTARRNKYIEQALPLFSQLASGQVVLHQTLVEQAIILAFAGKKNEAYPIFDEILKGDKVSPNDYYNAACFYSICKDTTRALAMLRKAVIVSTGFVENIESDPDLKNIHDLPEFKSLVKELEARTSSPPR